MSDDAKVGITPDALTGWRVTIPCDCSNGPGACSAEILARQLDRDWFKANPDRRHRIRRAIAGELSGVTDAEHVVVRQDFPGTRVRWPFLALRPSPVGEASEEFSERIFEQLVEQGLPPGAARIAPHSLRFDGFAIESLQGPSRRGDTRES